MIGEIAAPEYPANADDAAKRTADAGRIGLFREQTREARMRISDEAEARYGRKVAWGATDRRDAASCSPTWPFRS